MASEDGVCWYCKLPYAECLARYSKEKPKPRRRRPTDTERLDVLLRWMRQAKPISDYWTRAKIDRQMREEARRGKK